MFFVINILKMKEAKVKISMRKKRKQKKSMAEAMLSKIHYEFTSPAPG